MSANTTITATEFRNLTGEVTYGFRMYDDYGQSYNNCAESMITDDMELLRFVLDNADDTCGAMFDNIRDMQEGIMINGNHYEFEDISDYLN